MVHLLTIATDLGLEKQVGGIRTAVADSLRTTVAGALQTRVKAKATHSSELQALTAIPSRWVQGHTLGLGPGPGRGLVLDLDLAGLVLGLARMTTQEKRLEMRPISRDLVQDRLQLQYLVPSSPTMMIPILAHRLMTQVVQYPVPEAAIPTTMVRVGIGRRDGAHARVAEPRLRMVRLTKILAKGVVVDPVVVQLLKKARPFQIQLTPPARKISRNEPNITLKSMHWFASSCQLRLER